MPVTFDVHGPDGAATVLLSSGLGGAAAFWQPQLPALLAAGYRVIAYDQRGTGRSPGTLPAPYTIAHMAQDVVEVLDASGTAACHLVGHALGGLVGLQLALDAPGRVSSLVLVNAWSAPNPHSARCFDARLALLAAHGPRAYVEAQPIFLYPAAWCAANAARVQAEVDHAFAHFPGEATMRARIAALRAFDVDARLGSIGVPVMVAAAMDDTLVPWTCSQRLADGLPDTTFERVPHGGHAHTVTDSPTFNAQLLAFLARAGAGRLV
ncbi:pyrimidine utilization protein D [Rhizobacter sp. Root1221]|uniref:pyrimidine utilization protein D n=1 Tax=Rhizobacter sp. Root1221 TaxID=1736433 RepID=UPI0006F4D55C|nr:pyrimidine utilization protein D [Rhizobacter sp. Root1221]KQV86312.1 pyrimidine utilization protein D [Rhizobacter sp. Root1221]